jgi:hypothetical protein
LLRVAGKASKKESAIFGYNLTNQDLDNLSG